MDSCDSLNACLQVVRDAKQALLDSPDMPRLRAAFAAAAAAYATPAGAHRQAPLLPSGGLRGARGRASSATVTPQRPPLTAAAAHSHAAPPADAMDAQHAAATTTATAPAGAATASDAVTQTQQPWKWEDVRTLAVYGLGSFQERSGRTGQRLLQLALALALSEDLLPGLVNPPLAFDPAWGQFDRRMLRALGFSVPEGGAMVAAVHPTLVYMPCTSRELYDELLTTNWSGERLQNLALLGTSFSSLAASSMLFTVLTQPAAMVGAPAPASQRRAGAAAVAAAATPAAAPGGGVGGAAGGGADATSASFAAGDAGGGSPGAELHAALLREGAVVEAFVPDCAAHGIGTSLHLFPGQRLRRCGLLPDV